MSRTPPGVVVDRCDLRDGYSISRLIHGGWQFSSGHSLSWSNHDEAIDVLESSAEMGVTTFDCADIYTGVEELYGRFLKRWASSSNTAQIQIHTKFVPDWSDLPLVDQSYVRRTVERSLTRLGVERLDLVQYYWWRDGVPGFEDTAGWLDDMRAEGKIRHVGVTNLDVSRIQRLETVGFAPIINQVQYSLLDRRPARSMALHCKASGMRVLASEEDLGRELITSLNSNQQEQAILQIEVTSDIFTMAEAEVSPLDNSGISYAELSSQQKLIMMSLVEELASMQPEVIAQERIDSIRSDGLDLIRFAWAGGLERGDAHYYRVQGPSFLIEYDNTQNNANHIHLVWRDFVGDFGRDLIRSHYQSVAA